MPFFCHPQKNCYNKGCVNSESSPVLVEFRLDGNFDFLFLEREDYIQNYPGCYDTNKGNRQCIDNPLAETDGVITGKIRQCDCVRRCTDWSCDTADIGGKRNGQDHSLDTAVAFIDGGKHRGHHCEHHNSGCGVTHKHCKASGDGHNSEHNATRAGTERFQQYFCQGNVKFVLT